ncbi:MAG: hypothetical protein A2289_18590 [Deltaproteobacteria bacterium RIFOXYA12_FULL_58_15]|nr:MAG: hypothetical protein A2289_18590 [Deltaproteobacteria bacterium RIFOXYA12_FULL_58_15]OGR12841.1 MAG: hypothetical protein A2341_21945 [Deltaproteobacteria bacterium RIFOXYB12_FULL_58_9]
MIRNRRQGPEPAARDLTDQCRAAAKSRYSLSSSLASVMAVAAAIVLAVRPRHQNEALGMYAGKVALAHIDNTIEVEGPFVGRLGRPGRPVVIETDQNLGQ